MKIQRYIIGLGCPRSGTKALARLLDAQPGVCCSHERHRYVPWAGASHYVDEAVKRFMAGEPCVGSARRPVRGDVSYAWLKALPALEEALGERLTVVAIRRELEEWLPSAIDNMDREVLHDQTPRARQFPTYTLGADIESEADAWASYWHAYYEAVPEEAVVTTSMLNSRQGQGRILSLCGIPKEERIYLDPQTLNPS